MRLAILLLLLPTVPLLAEEPATRPNILFVMADDLGWMDLACQGNKLVDTPNIDRFASEGMRFTDAYAAAPVCTPTRAAVLTGQAPARLHITTHYPGLYFPKDDRPQPADMEAFLATEHVTIAERLREAGYANGFFGKWHLAPSVAKGGKVADEHSPLGQGFDVNLGGTSYGGPPSFFSPYKNAELPDGEDGEYLPDRMVAEVTKFVDDHPDQPWMAHLWFYTVHWPMEAPEDLLKKYETREGPGLNDTRYGAMIEAMDNSFGRLMASLEERGLGKNTLVIFTSDNGGFSGVSDCRPLRESKGHLYEGGIRVPLIARWPGRIAPGSLCDEPTVSMDFYPTFLEIAGLKPAPDKKLDGESLLPLLTGSGKPERKALYFHYPNYAWHMDNRLGSVVREGDYKLIRFFDNNSVELYKLTDDLSEENDLAAEEPERAERMNRMLGAWLEETGAAMPKPAKP